MSVLVLMSTYNGEKYIRDQLDSILKQDYEDLEILIRDDGSTDATHTILDEYKQNHTQISVYKGKNLGVQKSFFNLIEKAGTKKDYYAFADQDDVWLSKKISRAVHILKQYQSEVPMLYCSDKRVVDDQLQPLNVTVRRVMRRARFGNALVQNMCTGCTAVLNRTLMQMIREHTPDYVIMHDWWFYLTASCFGKVYYDKESFILYRQHGRNASGAMINKKELIKYRIGQLLKTRGDIYRQALEFQDKYAKILSIDEQNNGDALWDSGLEQNKMLLSYLLLSQRNIAYRLKLIGMPDIFRQKLTDDLVFRLIVLIGKL